MSCCPEHYARMIAPELKRVGATCLVTDRAFALEVVEILEGMDLRYPVAAWLSETGTTLHLTPIREDATFINDRLNIQTGLKDYQRFKARGFEAWLIPAAAQA